MLHGISTPISPCGVYMARISVSLKTSFFLPLLWSILVFTGCGDGSSGGRSQTPEPTIRISPDSVKFQAGETRRFTVAVNPADYASLPSFSVVGNCGSISAEGVFVAIAEGKCSVVAAISGSRGQKVTATATVAVVDENTFEWFSRYRNSNGVGVPLRVFSVGTAHGFVLAVNSRDTAGTVNTNFVFFNNAGELFHDALLRRCETAGIVYDTLTDNIHAAFTCTPSAGAASSPTVAMLGHWAANPALRESINSTINISAPANSDVESRAVGISLADGKIATLYHARGASTEEFSSQVRILKTVSPENIENSFSVPTGATDVLVHGGVIWITGETNGKIWAGNWNYSGLSMSGGTAEIAAGTDAKLFQTGETSPTGALVGYNSGGTISLVNFNAGGGIGELIRVGGNAAQLSDMAVWNGGCIGVGTANGAGFAFGCGDRSWDKSFTAYDIESIDALLSAGDGDFIIVGIAKSNGIKTVFFAKPSEFS